MCVCVCVREREREREIEREREDMKSREALNREIQTFSMVRHFLASDATIGQSVSSFVFEEFSKVKLDSTHIMYIDNFTRS